MTSKELYFSMNFCVVAFQSSLISSFFSEIILVELFNYSFSKLFFDFYEKCTMKISVCM
ncbi:hypothetical protein KFK09_018213 [Dendrobium nobile]|uniref:Uncharacterized protein n=1 Tax=Dendrobium nobile TaxID=94219 RepID=A0A8T3B0N0_DENNO|nr:hypothetical protein KFK09_018213 [Dendrobium nobile]